MLVYVTGVVRRFVVDLLPTAREGIKKVTTVILTVFLIFLFVAGAMVVCQRSQRA